MGKGLEALEELKRQIGNLEFVDFRNGIPQRTTFLVKDTSLFNDIETDLKALEIIKEEEAIYVFEEKGEYWLVVNMFAISISKEKYDLLKEVLL